MENTLKHHCEAFDMAIKEEYLEIPIRMVEEEVDGQKRIDLRCNMPALRGPRLSPHSKHTKPLLMLNFCPWCGTKLEGADET